MQRVAAPRISTSSQVDRSRTLRRTHLTFVRRASWLGIRRNSNSHRRLYHSRQNRHQTTTKQNQTVTVMSL